MYNSSNTASENTQQILPRILYSFPGILSTFIGIIICIIEEQFLEKILGSFVERISSKTAEVQDCD
jgi:hypothetical protein